MVGEVKAGETGKEPSEIIVSVYSDQNVTKDEKFE